MLLIRVEVEKRVERVQPNQRPAGRPRRRISRPWQSYVPFFLALAVVLVLLVVILYLGNRMVGALTPSAHPGTASTATAVVSSSGTPAGTNTAATGPSASPTPSMPAGTSVTPNSQIGPAPSATTTTSPLLPTITPSATPPPTESASTPSATPSISSASAASLTSTPLPVHQATQLPKPTPTATSGVAAVAPPVFSSTAKQVGSDFQPGHLATIFRSDTTRIYAFVTLTHIAKGTPIRFLWTRRATGHVLDDLTEQSTGAFRQHTFMAYAFPDVPPFGLGPYDVSIYVNGQRITTSSFVISDTGQ